MRIALLAPFEESVPPEKYGGTERVVYSLAEGLVRLGHDVTLLASADSKTTAKLVPCTERALRTYLTRPRTMSFLQWRGFHRALEHLQTHTYDIVHNHGDWPFLIASAFIKAPLLTTIHNPKQYKFGLKAIYKRYPYVSISDAQRNYMPDLNYIATVHNGIDPASFECSTQPGAYLAFLGRIHPDKGILQAVQVARATKQKLVIAAKLDSRFQSYFHKTVEPFIDDKQIIFIGEIGHEAKVDLLKNAKALLSPIQWDEPFGLTNVEALACGTPVIAMARGALTEIISHGKTGFLCNSISEMIAAVPKLDHINRSACRKAAEQRFSDDAMAKKYVTAYEQVALAYAEAAARAEAAKRTYSLRDNPLLQLDPYRFMVKQPKHLAKKILRPATTLRLPRIDPKMS